MRRIHDRGDREFLSVLQRVQPAGIQDLCAAVGVTATAVRQRLSRLESVGLVEKVVMRQSRGRPSHSYSVTEQGFRELGDDHAEIAALLWREILRIDSPEVRARALGGIRAALVERFRAGEQQTDLTGRLRTLCESLKANGFDVEFSPAEETNALPVLRGYNCPYHELVVEDASFCELEQGVFSELLGVPLERSHWREEGHCCCEFKVGAAGH